LPEFELREVHLCSFRGVVSLVFLDDFDVAVYLDGGPRNSESGKWQVEKAECWVES